MGGWVLGGCPSIFAHHHPFKISEWVLCRSLIFNFLILLFNYLDLLIQSHDKQRYQSVYHKQYYYGYQGIETVFLSKNIFWHSP